jgi:Poxvirus Late Transcription Factor VLTF3 like
MAIDYLKTRMCRVCWECSLVTDRGSADILCTNCGAIWGKWSPEHPGDLPPVRPAYERNNYFETVLDNTLGFDTPRFTMNDLAAVRRAAPPADDWDVGRVRAATRKLRLKRITKAAGRMAHALRYGVDARYPRLHHVEREAMAAMFAHVTAVFERVKGNKGRKNLISYAFVIGKLLHAVGREEFDHLIVPIKTKSKRLHAERVWREVERDAPWLRKRKRDDNATCQEYVQTLVAKRPSTSASDVHCSGGSPASPLRATSAHTVAT